MNKRNELISKNIINNRDIFADKIFSKNLFFKEILDWQKKLRVTKNSLGDVLADRKIDPKKQKKADEYGRQLLEKVVKENDVQFMRWFYTFFERFELSRSWENTIINLIACDYFCPPITNNTKSNKFML